MIESFGDLISDRAKLSTLLSDLKRAASNGHVEIAEDGRLFFGSNIKAFVGGIFHFKASRHEQVQRAIDDKDPEKEAWMRRWVRKLNLQKSRQGYFEMPEYATDDHNTIVNKGLNFLNDLLFYTDSKISTWYYGPFISNWTPVATADSNWAGATSGPLATELPDAGFDESNRQAATFGSASSSQTITTSAYTDITISAGMGPYTFYGLTLNEIATVAYNAADKELYAATTFSASKGNLSATDVIHLGYSHSAANA